MGQDLNMSSRNELYQIEQAKRNKELRKAVQHFVSHVDFDDNYKMPKQVRSLYLNMCVAQHHASKGIE